MNIEEAIKSFSQQFLYNPEVVNAEKLKKFDRFIFVGMGGSGLAPDFLRTYNPRLDVIIHRDYGLPPLDTYNLRNTLIVCNSYSGNTEEVINSFNEAMDKNLSVAAISTGGRLLELARQLSIPYIEMPDWKLQPRLAVGLNFRSLLKIIGDQKGLEETLKLSNSFFDVQEKAKNLAQILKDKIPIIYASRQNGPISYSWKVILNETSKVPAFANIFPELNHNEMASFDLKNLSDKFYFLFLKDDQDYPQISKRMSVLSNIFKERGLLVDLIDIEGFSIGEKIFKNLVLANWTAYYLAENYKLDPIEVTAIEEFKKLI